MQKRCVVWIFVKQRELEETLRLLQLSETQRRIAAAAGISQRQALPLASLPEDQRARIFAGIEDSDLTLAEQGEALRERLHVGPEPPRQHMGAVKDVRIFFNTLQRAVEMMRQAGCRPRPAAPTGRAFPSFASASPPPPSSLKTDSHLSGL